jgi:hypothetical protein
MEIYQLIAQYIDDDNTIKPGVKYSGNELGYFTSTSKVSDFIKTNNLDHPILIYCRVIIVDEHYDTGHGNYIFFNLQGEITSTFNQADKFTPRENKFNKGDLVYYLPDTIKTREVILGEVLCTPPTIEEVERLKLDNSDNVYMIGFDVDDHAHPIEEFLHLVMDKNNVDHKNVYFS